jgi:putative FmdB family regulatory protein
MTYEYLCTACDHEWEAEQRISEAPLEVCPACGGRTAKRQVSGGAGFLLKGGGWYADGYASARPSKGSDSSSGTSTASKPSSGTAASSTGASSAGSSGTGGGGDGAKPKPAKSQAA